MKAYFDETGKLLYNSYGLPTSITSRQSQIESFYVIEKEVFNQIIFMKKISRNRSSGKREKGDIENYLRSLRPHEDISDLFAKDSRLISYGSRDEINEVVRSIGNLYLRYKNNSQITLPNETVYYILFDSFTAKLEYYKDTNSKTTPYGHDLVGQIICDRGVKKLNDKEIIGVLHTHPPEVLEWNGTSKTNNDIFNRQKVDFDTAERTKIPHYSIGATEIDYYSSKGIDRSKNRLCSNDAFIHGQFDLLKYTFVEYANTF